MFSIFPFLDQHNLTIILISNAITMKSANNACLTINNKHQCE